MASTFHPFPRLPTELRLAIWDLAVEPQDVRLIRKFAGISKRAAYVPNYAKEMIWKFETKAPVAGQVCHEAREHLEKSYVKASFGNTLRYVWFNPHTDNIWIKNCFDLKHIVDTPDAKFIQRMTLDITQLGKVKEECLDYLRHLDKTLQNLVLIDRMFDHRNPNLPLQIPGTTDQYESWMYKVLDLIAHIYWRCNAPPFHTTFYRPHEHCKSRLTRNNFLALSRVDHAEQVRKFMEHYPDLSIRQHYINNADSYWSWSHDDCECKSQDQSLGQQLLDVCIAKHPIDVGQLIKHKY